MSPAPARVVAPIAIGRVAAVAGAYKAAAHILVERAADGLLLATATKAVTVYRAAGTETSWPEWEIPVSIWRADASTLRAADHLFWETGNFNISDNNDGKVLRLLGIGFEAVQIDALVAEYDPARNLNGAATASKGGNPGKIEEWHQFWLAAMAMLDNGELEDREKYPGQAQLREALLSRIGNKLSDESIKPQVSKLWHKFVRKGG